MKYKKGNPITCINDLVEYINYNEYMYHYNEFFRSSDIKGWSLGGLLVQIENRNFYYAIKDTK